MNTKHNQRSRATISTIQSIFISLLKEKHITKITIKELCQKAAVNRTTFYTHYQDIYDLMEQMESEMAAQMFAFFQKEKDNIRTANHIDFFSLFFTWLLENRYFYQAYLGSNTGNYYITLPPFEFLDKNSDIYETASKLSEREREYRAVYFKAGLGAIIRAWFRNNCAETPGEMAHYISREYVRDII